MGCLFLFLLWVRLSMLKDFFVWANSSFWMRRLALDS